MGRVEYLSFNYTIAKSQEKVVLRVVYSEGPVQPSDNQTSFQ